jgi:hypothetical protein
MSPAKTSGFDLRYRMHVVHRNTGRQALVTVAAEIGPETWPTGENGGTLAAEAILAARRFFGEDDATIKPSLHGWGCHGAVERLSGDAAVGVRLMPVMAEAAGRETSR